MANEQNLKPFRPDLDNGLSTERAREIGRKGGIASGEARRRRRTIKEAMQTLLSAGLITDEKTKDLLLLMGVDNPTNADGIAITALLKSLRGDVEAMRYVRDSGGEMPTSKVEVGGIEDKPLQVLDLSTLTDAQLQELAQRNLDK